MKALLMETPRADRDWRSARCLAWLIAAAFGGSALSAGAAPAPSATGAKSAHVTLEPIGTTGVKRITLTAKAAERLGIETAAVSEAAPVRKQVVGGLVVPAMTARPPDARPPSGDSFGRFGGFGGAVGDYGRSAPAADPKEGGKSGSFQRIVGPPSSPASAGAGRSATAASSAQAKPADPWVLVTLSPGEWERVAKDQPARVLPLATRDKPERPVLAKLVDTEPREDNKRSMLSLYYTVPGQDHGLTLNKRMRVELPLAGSEEKRKVVPYGSVYYDSKGAAWLYVNPKPLVFERQRISVERVVGDLAVLSEGPPVGTSIVSVGAALLYGTEIFGK
jgi:hypothetical protein